MKNLSLKRKGFTIVELVIVIAVIAVLAAILIPTFVGMSKKANMSADQQAVRQMNMVLAGENFDTIEEAVDALSKAGYNALDSLVPLSTGHTFWWLEEYNSIVLINGEEEVVFASNNNAKEKFAEAKAAGKAFNLKRGLPGKEVTNVDDARESLEKGQSVTLTTNLDLGLDNIKISKGEDVVIDLGGNTITVGKEDPERSKYAIDNQGTITIKNGTISSRGIGNNGTLIIGEDVVVNAVDNNGGACIWNYASGEVIVNGGTFTATGGDKGDTEETIGPEPGAINNSGKMTIKGGTYTALNTGCYLINNTGEITIDGGTFTAWRGVVASTNGSVTINGGTFEKTDTTNSGYVFYVAGSSTITVGSATKVILAGTEYAFAEISWTGHIFTGNADTSNSNKVVLQEK